mgnify:CR=1 FL=1
MYFLIILIWFLNGLTISSLVLILLIFSKLLSTGKALIVSLICCNEFLIVSILNLL